MRAYSTGARAALAFPKRRGYSRRNSKLAAFRLIQEAAAMALRVMSADSHMDLVYLPPDTFTSRMDPKWGDAAPHVVERDGRKWWVSPPPRRDARGGRVAPLRHARPARCRARPVGLGDARVARDVGARVVHRRGDGPRRLVPRLRGRRRDRRLRGEGDPPPGGHRLVDNRRADADGRDLRLGDPLGRVRAPPEAPPRVG